jgi:UDP-N-acetylmuramoyl-tripeptide--D-alanyl-D-alanine ligase
VVAITGSNGKTSTRKMTAGVVSRRFSTLSTYRNLNNHIGLPLTLLNLSVEHQWAVLELGMNHPGEIKRLGEICSPDIGVITNIGPAHLEGLGSLDAVMHAKGELLEEIKPDGTAVLNADDPKLLHLAHSISRKVLFYGRSKNARIRALSVKGTETGLSFDLVLPEERVTVDLKTPAVFMISNALAAAAVGYLLGLTAGEIKEGLEAFKPVPGRMNIIKTGKGITIIDDTYNANPGSMKAAITTLGSLKGGHPGILVAGDMLELGTHAESMHRNIGRIVAGSNIADLYVTGEFARTVAQGAMDKGMDIGNIFTGTKEEILEDIKYRLGPGDWVLVKGSRSMTMETIVQDLLDWAGD